MSVRWELGAVNKRYKSLPLGSYVRDAVRKEARETAHSHDRAEAVSTEVGARKLLLRYSVTKAFSYVTPEQMTETKRTRDRKG